MDTENEALLGEVPVTTRLRIGLERLRLFLTSHRLIVDHVGKRGTGALATTSFFGRLSNALEDLVKGGRERSKRESVALRPSDILAADKDNFYVGYPDVVSVQLDESRGIVEITVLTKHDKFQFQTAMAFEHVAELFGRVLGDKTTTRRATPVRRDFGS